jgi:hypothetical protein
MLIRWLIVGLLACCWNAEARDVFRTDTPDGAVYSDTESPGSTRITIEAPLQVPVHQWSSAQPIAAPAAPTAALDYVSLAIASPSNDETVRSNSGDLAVTIASEPPLQTEHGHTVKISVDGKVHAAAGSGLTYTVSTLDRGTHTLAAMIVDRAGAELVRSAPVVVHLHRHSVKFRKKPVPKPPKK